jgi:uridine phosphorylase
MLGHKATTCCMVIANRYDKEMNTTYKNSMENILKTVLDRI